MNFFLRVLCLFYFFPLHVFATGENCTTPIAVTVSCPATTLTGQSSIGKGNDVNSWKYSSFSTFTLNGEDLVYEITYPTGTSSLVLSMNNVNQYAYLFTTATCAISSSTVYPMTTVSNGNNNNITLALPTTGTVIYLYVDHSGSSALTYDITFGAVTKGTYITIPDTRGKLEFSTSTCVSTTFLNQVDVHKDGTQLNTPASFGPNNASHEFCYDIFLQNLTGKEGIKSIQFTFNAGFINVNTNTTSLPGRYASGTWNATTSGNVVTWTFTNSSDPTKGDYDDITKTCMQYSFCMSATPTATVPQQIMNIWCTGDGKTMGYSGYQYSGCCASNNCSLYGADGYPAGTGAAGFGIGIGTGGLPVDLLNVWIAYKDQHAFLNWQTTHEKNLSSYAPQYSIDGKAFEDFASVNALAHGESSFNNYQILLNDLSQKKGYLRIKSIDEDGSLHFSKAVTYDLTVETRIQEVVLSPNPAQDKVHIQSVEDIRELKIYDANGTCIHTQSIPINEQVKELEYNLNDQKKGLYTLQIITDQGISNNPLLKD